MTQFSIFVFMHYFKNAAKRM